LFTHGEVKKMTIVKKWAVVKDGKVANTVLADEEFASAHPDHIEIPVAPTPTYPEDWNKISTGWEWSGFKFTPPPRDVASEQAAAVERRNALLGDSDAYIANDLWMNYTPAEQQAWADYRSDLRNLFTTFPDDPQDIVWPISPNSPDATI